MEIILGVPYHFKAGKNEYIVVPFDGDTIGQPGISHGFVHYDNYFSEEYIGFCGTFYFEENAVMLTDIELKKLGYF